MKLPLIFGRYKSTPFTRHRSPCVFLYPIYGTALIFINNEIRYLGYILALFLSHKAHNDCITCELPIKLLGFIKRVAPDLKLVS